MGFGLGTQGVMYESGRTNRTREVTDGLTNWAPVVGGIDAMPLRGEVVRLRARVRAQSRSRDDHGTLWMRVDRADGKKGAFDNMDDRPIRDDQWAVYELVLPVADDATHLAFGAIATGKGTVEVDDFELSIAKGERYEPVPIANPGFEEGKLAGWRANVAGFSFDVVAEGEGKILRISRNSKTQRGALFKETPEPGEVLDLPLGARLRLRLPVVLPSHLAKRPRPDPSPTATSTRSRMRPGSCSTFAGIPTQTLSSSATSSASPMTPRGCSCPTSSTPMASVSLAGRRAVGAYARPNPTSEAASCGSRGPWR